MPAGPAATSPNPALDPGTEPPAIPRKRERLLLGALLLAFIALLGRMEAAALAPYPLALVVSGILVFALLCVTRLEAAFLLVLAVVPFSMELLVAGTGNALQMPTEPMLFVALAAWGARSLVRRSHTFAQPGLMAALLLVLLGMLVSMGVSAYRVASLKATLNAAWYALFGLFLANNLADRGRLKLLAWAILVPGVAIALYSTINVAPRPLPAAARLLVGGPLLHRARHVLGLPLLRLRAGHGAVHRADGAAQAPLRPGDPAHRLPGHPLDDAGRLGGARGLRPVPARRLGPAAAALRQRGAGRAPASWRSRGWWWRAAPAAGSSTAPPRSRTRPSSPTWSA